MRPIDTIIVHCTDSPDKMDVGVKEITEWHLARHFETCGYHKVVRRSGVVENGRPLAKIGAHCEGHNATSLGVVWVGRDKPALAQALALRGVLVDLCKQFGLEAAAVKGHKEFNPGKTCPNLDMDALRADIDSDLRNPLKS
jgi:N-acetylmuramoyl-L-alanine amidase